MKFLELIEKRQSDRVYIDKKVDREKINRCLEAARLAPVGLIIN
jgi:nitroreductase